MVTTNRLLGLASYMLACAACGDDAGEDTLDAKRLADLSSEEQRALCQRRQPHAKRTFQELGLISCTNVARLYYEESCESERSACVTKLPQVDFDICASPDDKARFFNLFREVLADDPYLSDVLEPGPTLTTDFDVSPSCPLTVAQVEACQDALAGPNTRAAQEYTCTSGEEAVEYPVPEPCYVLSETAADCGPPS